MSYGPYPQYKDSGVEWLGEVPEHWRTKPIWTLFTRTKRTGYPDETLLSVYRDYGVVPTASRDDNHNRPSEDLSCYQLVEQSDLAINKMKAWQGSVAISNHRGIVSPAYHIYKAHHEEDPRYLHHLFRCNEYISGYLANSKGIRVNQWDLEPQQHSRMQVLLPSVSEQTQIARFLDHETGKIDGLIAEQEKLIELLKEKRQATISHAVTKGLNPDVPLKDSGVEWLGEVPEHWCVGVQKHGIAFIESGTSVNAADYPASNEELGVLKTSCVYTGSFDWHENKTVNEEDLQRVTCPLAVGTLIVSRMNTPELVGAAGFVKEAPQNIFLPDRLWQVHFDENYSTEFMYWFSLSRAYREQIKIACSGTSSSMQNLAQDDFKNIKISFPPRDEQNQIVKYLDRETAKLDALLTEAQRGIELLKERRSALISAAVTGKIDVRSWKPQGDAA